MSIIKRLIFCMLVFGLVFSFSFSKISSEESVFSSITFGPQLALADDDDDDEKDDDDDDEGDTDPFVLFSFFDLRDRETFIQITNVGSSSQFLHIQVYNVNNDCNENNFYDNFTGNDTHVYNIRDIITNDGNPAGFVLPENAYGAVIVSTVTGPGGVIEDEQPIVGNVRMLDNLGGYEYRTNIPGRTAATQQLPPAPETKVYTFNFNTEAGVTLSDVFGITTAQSFEGSQEVLMANPTTINNLVDIDVYNLDEVPFSCRDVLFACINEDSTRYQETLEEEGVAVASFEYGINDAIPSSKGAELLCPGNNISEGFVTITEEDAGGRFLGYIGLNSGNGRGTIDSFWTNSRFTDLVNP